MTTPGVIIMELCTYIAICALLVLHHGIRVCEGQGQSWDSPHTGPEYVIPPSFQDTPDYYEVRQGQMARLLCSINNLGTKKVIWRRTSQANPLTIGTTVFINNNRISIEHKTFAPEWVLVIKQVQLDDEDRYECQVSSKDRQLRKHMFLKVLKGPIINPGRSRGNDSPAGISVSGNTFVEKNQQLQLMCNATSGGDNLPDEIDWFFDGQKLSSDDSKGISIVKKVQLMDRTIHSVLRIRSVAMGDAGVYVCRTSDLQVDSARVDVLNADTKNIKRGTEKNSSQDKYGNPKSRHDRLDKPQHRGTPGENGSGPLAPSRTGSLALLTFLSCLVIVLTQASTTTRPRLVVAGT